MIASREAIQVEYSTIINLFNSGDITKATKQQLERFAVLLTRPEAPMTFNSQHPQVCETVRMLLLVRISEESNSEASRISIIALLISALALITGLVQAGAATWQILHPLH